MARNRIFRFLSWNVRGLNDRVKCSVVRSFIKSSKASVVCLQETKLSSTSLDKFNSFCGYHLREFRTVDAIGTRGGILTAWNPYLFDCLQHWAGTHLLNTLLRQKIDGCLFLISNVYGPTGIITKTPFFDEIRYTSALSQGLWLVMGDFNIILSLQDKNGIPSNISDILAFRATVNDTGLFDVPLQNKAFTWSNGRRNPILERLDRALISQDWLLRFLRSTLKALPRPRSDHSPLVLSAFTFIPSPCLFRFESCWLHCHSLPDVVSNSWMSAIHGSDPISIFNAKAERLRNALTAWSRGFSSVLKCQSSNCLTWIAWLESAEEVRSLSSLECSLRPRLKLRYEELSLIEEIRWKQRSRVRWLREGDANTKFFHLRASCRRSINSISQLSDGNNLLSTPVPIANHLYSFFSSQLGRATQISASISFSLLYGQPDVDLSFLVSPFTSEEVKLAVWSSAPDKAPGPDGFPILFYRRFWHLLKTDILEIFRVFFHGSVDLSSLNSGWICPIPKAPSFLLASDLRPISLIHSLGKIISKVLAIRIQPVMNQLINPFQAAFIKGRDILDNFFCAHILTHHLKTTNTPAAVLKIDFQRAFDHISWDFLLDLLLARGFAEKWINWISMLLGSNSSAVLLNGVPGRSFAHKKGLRQGDPLSPLIFVLCMDVLFRMVDKAVLSNHLPAVGIGDTKVHSLHFADDVLFFFDGSPRSATILKAILDAFSNCSGLKINFGKSTLTPINIAEAQAADISAIFNCPLQAFPLSYLGLPLSPKKLRRADYLPLIENIDKRLAGWKCASLSRGGRLILLNSVLSSLPLYFCSVFALPSWVIKDIDKIRRGFFWKGKNKTNGFHCLANWKQICRPRTAGGVGIRNLQVANSALLMKSLWKYFSTPSLPWIALLKQKHYKRRPAATALNAPKGCCPVWRGILRMQAPFFTSIDFILHNGTETPFWNSRWSGTSSLKNRFPNLHEASSNLHISVSTWATRFANRQNLGFAFPLNFQEHLEFQHLSLLSNNLVLEQDTNDSIFWRWTSDGSFSVKSASDFLSFDGLNICNPLFPWKLKIPLRVKLFLWLAERNKVLTTDNLMKRGWYGPTICVFCNSQGESLTHILFTCTFAISVWKCLSTSAQLNLAGTSFLAEGLEARWIRVRRMVPKDYLQLFDIGYAAFCWEIWKERNRRIFENRHVSFEILGRIIHQTVLFWKGVLGRFKP